MGKNRQYDWETIKQEYVLGDDKVNLTGLSDKYKIPYRTIYKRYSIDGWQDEREEFRRDKQDDTKKKMIEKHSNNILSVADLLHIINQMVAQKINTAVKDKKSLSDEKLAQYSRILGFNGKQMKLFIGEHTEILKIDNDAELKKAIQEREKYMESGADDSKEEDDIDLNQAGKNWNSKDDDKEVN